MKDVYGGLEVVWRDLDEPAPTGGRGFTEDRKEELYRAYVYWTPGINWAVRLGAEYDVFDSRKPADKNLRQVQTLGFPVAVRYFNRSGYFAGVGASIVYQDVKRQDGEGLFVAEGHDTFVVADASVGYRFPDRRGSASLEARNIFDEGFKFQDNSYRVAQAQPNVSPFMPERAVFVRVALSY
ncbi:MAG: hypothetical protein ACXW1O_08140 [Halobacteriota archaeon]